MFSLLPEAPTLERQRRMPISRTARRTRTHAAQTALPIFHLGSRHLRPTGNIARVDFTPTLPSGITDKVWSPYIPRALAAAAPPHPTPLLTPTVQRAIELPPLSSPVMLDRGLIEQGILSREQLDLIARALAAFDKTHIDEDDREVTCGFLVGFGTGSGKTSVAIGVAQALRNLGPAPQPTVIATTSRLIAGVFRSQSDDLGIPNDQFRLLEHASLDTLARIDLARTPYLSVTYAILRRDIGGTVESVEAHLQHHPNAPYAEMVAEAIRKAKSERKAKVHLRFSDVLCACLPSHTLWVFDECDALRNTRSDQGVALQRIDKAMPRARMLFLSATPIPLSAAFKYLATRLALAGSVALYRTPESVSIGAQKTRMAELLIAEGVSLGTIASGGLSFEGITYKTVVTRTTDAQRAMLDQYQAIVTGVLTYAQERLKRYNALQFDEAQFTLPTAGQLTMLARRALQTLLMDICRPALFAEIDACRASEQSVVIEVARTGEAQRREAVAQGDDQRGVSGKYLIEQLITLGALPVNVKVIEVGAKRLLVDRNPQRTAATTASFNRALNAILEDDHVLTDLASRYGSEFAEVTGRNVRTERNNGVLHTARRVPAKANAQAIRDFADGNVHILAISEAGSRGIDAHAGASFKNQEKRNLLVFDPFLSPAEFSQIIGRVCRTGQVSWPNVTFFTTDIPALSANLGVVVSKTREAGACSFGERDSVAVRADVLTLENNDSATVLPVLGARLLDDPRLSPFVASVHGAKTMVNLVRWIATLPTCDRYPLQQQMWHHLTHACESTRITIEDRRTYQIDQMTVAADTVAGLPASRLEISEPDQFVRTWKWIESQIDGCEAEFLETNFGPICAIPLPRYGTNPQEYRILSVRSARLGQLPIGKPITRTEARELWLAEMERVGRVRRTCYVAQPPFGRIRALDQAIAKMRGATPRITDDLLINNTHTIVDRSGRAAFGLFLHSEVRRWLEDGALALGAHDLADIA